MTPPSERFSSDALSFAPTAMGRSVEGRDILLYTAANNRGEAQAQPLGTLLVGGIHGDEFGTVRVLESFLERYLCTGQVRASSPSGAEDVGVISLANPDGFKRRTRYNAHGVDLNRNFETSWTRASEEPPGSAPWSEPESRALRDLILQRRPARIVTLHWALAELDADGPQSTGLARAMWEALSEEERAPYRLRVWEDAPDGSRTTEVCPGSLGQWCGYSVRYPDGTAPAIVTLELPYDPGLPRPAGPDPLPDDHLSSLHKAWDADADGYMAAVEGPIHKMLAAACRFA